jgi:hypothetical protein
MNPYAPPAAPALAPPAPFAPPEVKMRRPASVKWLIAVYSFGFAAAGVTFLAHGMRARIIQEQFGVTTPPFITLETGLQILGSVVPLLILLIAGRREVGYWIGGLFLLLEVIRRWVTTASYIADGFLEAANEVSFYASTILIIWLSINTLLLWLFIRFAFGRPSRLYFRVLKPEGA